MTASALLERIATALEAGVKLQREAQSDFRHAQEAHRKDVKRQQSEAQRARANSEKLHEMLTAQAAHIRERDRHVEEELARIARRDEATLQLLREAGERSGESLDTLKIATRTKAPDYVPENLATVPPEEQEPDDGV